MQVLSILTGLVLLFNGPLPIKENKYPVSEIPENLLENANAVYRHKNAEFIIEDIDRAKFKVHSAITIFNDKAKNHAIAVVGYDKLTKITRFEASVYDASGSLIKKMKKDDVVDQSNISGYSLYEDNRVKGANLQQKKYPYTVEFEYEIQYKFLYAIPNWFVLEQEKISVQKSTYSLIAPDHLKPRYKLFNAKEPEIKKEDDLTRYTWLFENQKAYVYERFSKGSMDRSPIIYAAPAKFKYDDYEGDMSTWKGLSDWQIKLNEGREQLPAESIKKVKELTADLTTDREKIKAVYEYMQSNTRYVSVQLGIGGFQPFKASVVDDVGYGDCKALSFYTQSLLRAVGIQSLYTWVEAGPNPREVYQDFPNDTFNHIILCVPNKGDTVWLECTSQSMPYGYLGEFTGDRDVFLITDEGGKIVRTPSYDGEKNKIHTSAMFELDTEGNANLQMQVSFSGLAYQYKYLDNYLKYTSEQQKEWLKKYIDLPNYQIQSYDFVETKDIIPSIDLKMDIAARKVASGSGKRWFIKPNMLSTLGAVPKMTDRKTPIYTNNSRIYSDSIQFSWPKNLHIENLPENVEVNSPFGSYNIKYVRQDNGITMIRKLSFNKGTFSPEKYSELFNFVKAVRRADSKKIVLLDKT